MEGISEKIAPKYRRIENDIVSMIKLGKINVGDRLPSELELSKKYGVSRLTARKAFDMLKDKGYLISKPGVGSFVANRQQNPVQTDTARKDIGLFSYTPSTGEQRWYWGLLEAVSRDSEAWGYHVTARAMSVEESANGTIPMAVVNGAVSGAIITGQLTQRLVGNLRKHSLRCIVVGNSENTYGLPCVDFDVEDMAHEVTMRLLSLDRGPVWFVGITERLFYEREIHRGYLRAIFEDSRDRTLSHVYVCEPEECQFVVEHMAKSGHKEHCLIVGSPEHWRSIVHHMKQRNMDLEKLTTVHLGLVPRDHSEADQRMVCHLNPQLLGSEAVRQIVGSFDNKDVLVGRRFKLHVEQTGNERKPFRFSWV